MPAQEGNPGVFVILQGVGAALALVRRSAVSAATLGRRRLLVTLEISSKDPSYLWFLQWMSARSASQSSLPGLAGRIRSHELAVETSQEQQRDGSNKTSFSLVPGPGTHFFKFKNSWFQVKRERDGKMMDLHSGTPWETVTLTTLSRDRHLFSDLLAEAQALDKASQIGKIVIYTAWGMDWRPFGQPRSKRLLESVVLDRGVKERIVEDVKSFMKRGTWYAERGGSMSQGKHSRGCDLVQALLQNTSKLIVYASPPPASGIPYRRGILLYGPPGSGKSSFIQSLAGSLDFNICVMNLSERGLTDDKLNHLLANAPERSIILLEDVDAAFTGRNQADEHGWVLFFAGPSRASLASDVDSVCLNTLSKRPGTAQMSPSRDC